MFFVLPLMAQNRIIKGKVTNDKGEPVQGAIIKIQGTDVKREYSTKTDKKGEYIYMGIPFGEYRIVVRAPGYLPDFAQGVRPTIAAESEISFSLKPGQSDAKLPFEMSQEEVAKIKEEVQKAEKQKEASAEVKAFFDAGLQLAQQGKYAEAIEQYDKALERRRTAVHSRRRRMPRQGRQNASSALEEYQKAIALKPDDAPYQHGSAARQDGKVAKSQEVSKAASINPARGKLTTWATLVNSGRAAGWRHSNSDAADQFAEAYTSWACAFGSQANTEAIRRWELYPDRR
jgi:tetratricopeptide (TPR) repeat protein